MSESVEPVVSEPEVSESESVLPEKTDSEVTTSATPMTQTATSEATSSESTTTETAEPESTTAEVVGVPRIDGSVSPREGNLKKGDRIIDTVRYEGLVPGKSYILFAFVTDQKTGKVLGSGSTELVPGRGYVLFASVADKDTEKTPGSENTGSAATASSGTRDVIITLDEDMNGSAVVSERLVSKEVDRQGKDSPSSEGNEIAFHDGRGEEDQTIVAQAYDVPGEESSAVSSDPSASAGQASSASSATPMDSVITANSGFVPDSKTTTSDVVSDANTPKANLKVTQQDGVLTGEVEYENLKADTEYVVTGQVVDKKTGQTTGSVNAATFRTPKASTPTTSGKATVAVPVGQTAEAQTLKTTVSTPKTDSEGRVVGVNEAVVSATSTAPQVVSTGSSRVAAVAVKTMTETSAKATTTRTSTQSTTGSATAKSAAPSTRVTNTARSSSSPVAQSVGAPRTSTAERVTISNVPSGSSGFADWMPAEVL